MVLGPGRHDELTPWHARWCWAGHCDNRPWNTCVYFRRALDLPGKANRAWVRISADSRYTLFVNGRRVHQGPARCHPKHQSFDTIDISEYLSAGTNVIGAIVHQFGLPTGQSRYHDASGFVLDGLVETNGGNVALHTPGGWLCRIARGWRKHVARLGEHLPFQEHFDADADPPAWLTAEYQATDTDGWSAPTDAGPVRGYPWVEMKGRGIPLLADEMISFVDALGQFTGENARGYKVAEDVFALAAGETRKRPKTLVENVEVMLGDDDQSATIAPPPDGFFHAVVLDLGQVRVGHVVLDVVEAAGDEILDLLYTTELDKSGGPLLTGSGLALADRYRCRPGAQKWEAQWAKGFRYLTLVLRNIEKPLRIRRIAVRSVHAAVELAGTFECSDERLTRTWKAGVETILACMQDGYIARADGQQLQEGAFLCAAFEAGATALGDVSLLERGIEQMAQSQAEDGSLHGFPPAQSPRGRSVGAMLAWIEALWAHHLYTGRTELLSRWRETLDRLVEFFSRHEKHEGLIGAFDGFDADGAADYSAALNLSYLNALRAAVIIYALLGAEKEEGWLKTKCQNLAASIERHFWDAKGKQWRDGFDPVKSAPTEGVSVATAALALRAGLNEADKSAIARDHLYRPMTAKRGKIAAAPPTMAGYAIDAMIDAGLRNEAVELIRARWGAMVDRGATTLWEQWDSAGASKCHAASAWPVKHLPQLILGIARDGAGWRRVKIEPVTANLEYARGALITPLGLVRVEWEKVGDDQLAVRVELPQGMTGEFIGPLGAARTLEAGSSEFHT